jgi:hypothetical protein
MKWGMDEVQVQVARPSRAQVVTAGMAVAVLVIAGTLAAGFGGSSGAMTAAQRASATAAAPTTANRAYVWGAYQLVAGQAPDDAALTHWSAFLDRGGERLTFVHELLTSPWAGARAVSSLYRQALGRDAAPTDVSAWMPAIAAGNYEAVAAAIVGSDEAVLHAGGYPSWVTLAYDTILGRPADDRARAHWAGQLAAKQVTPKQVVAALTGSWEYHAKVMAGVFRTVLDRAPDPDGQGWWAKQVDAHGVNAAEATFFSSDEVYQRIVTLAAPPGS